MMSGAISGTAGGNSTLARLIADSGEVRRRFDTLTQQASSGLISNTYAGLGRGAPVSLALNARITSSQTWQSNIDAASGRAQVTQTAMTRIQSIASNLVAKLTGLNGLDSAPIDTLAAEARNALVEVGGLLNTQYGDAYVFAGEDTANPPVPNPDQLTSSAFFTQIASAVGGLSGTGAAAAAASTLAVASSNAAGVSPFSTYLSQPAGNLTPPSVSTEQGHSETVGLLASANTVAVSGGSSTTGSYMRDLMRALATAGSMTSGQAGDPGFAALVEDTRASLSGGVTAMAADAGVLGQKQSALTAQKTRLQDTAAVLSTQVSAAEDVDMATVLSNLTLTQTQLQASYQLISGANGLSLVKFLGGG